MLKAQLKSTDKTATWSACPYCHVDLRPSVDISPPYLDCPICGAPIMPVWWQRIPWVALGFLLSYVVPKSIGLSGWDVFFVGLLCLFPATVFAYIVVFKIMPPRYVERRDSFMTLVRR